MPLILVNGGKSKNNNGVAVQAGCRQARIALLVRAPLVARDVHGWISASLRRPGETGSSTMAKPPAARPRRESHGA
ncbi:MAG: hypothetical protein ACOY45_12655 [Pseudomonadota bacterium]